MAMVIIMAVLINRAMIYDYGLSVNLVYRIIANGIHEAPRGYPSSYCPP
jgi:hypothetical protein